MRRTEKAAAVSTAAYVLLGGAMIAVASFSGSVSLIAEGIHTLTDCVTSAAVWIGLRLSERHSRTFPFGLYKLENLIATAIGILILFSAYEIASESIGQLTDGAKELTNPGVILVIMAVSIVVMGVLSWYKNKVAREENSPGLRADARHSLADMAAASAVFVGVALQAAGVAYADAIAALVVVLFLVWAGIEVTINGVKVLLDASIEQDVLFRAREIAQEHKGVRDVLAVEGRNSGSYRFLNLSLIPRTRDLAKAKNVADEVRDSIAREIPNVDRVRIDLQPQARESVLCAIPLEGDGVTVSKHFGEVEKFAFTNIKLPGGEIIGRESIGNPYSDLSRGKGVKVAEFLAQQGVELILVRESLQGKGAYYALETYGIQQLLRPEAERLRDAEELLAQSLAETEVQTGVDDSPS